MLEHARRLHFVGIGGIGMSGLALYLHHRGFTLSGSDAQESTQVHRLRAAGIPVTIGHAATNVNDADLVVVTSAIAGDMHQPAANPELVAAEQRGIPIVKRAQLLGEVVNRAALSIAVAGTHGKTTTTALIGHALRQNGIDATVLVGGVLHDADTNALVGDDDVVVVEADEYDRSFLWLYPTIAVITNIEYDHPDCYSNLTELEKVFVAFIGHVRDKLIVRSDALPLCCLASAQAVEMQTFNVENTTAQISRPKLNTEMKELRTPTGLPYWLATDVAVNSAGTSFTVWRGDQKLGRFSIPLLGAHNVGNALAAIAVSVAAGIDRAGARAALATFNGVERRLELKGAVGGVTILDDYAHHPTEVRATLAALRASGQRGNRLRVVFQPHTYSRTQALLSDFATAFDDADEVILLDIYAAREQPLPGISGQRLFEAMSKQHDNICYFAEQESALQYLQRSVKPGDVILTMGAGDVVRLGERLLSQLKGACHA
jgi:UDP-N-acetylmuramate--alanine ligase